jgi:hypothetical protein
VSIESAPLQHIRSVCTPRVGLSAAREN